MPLLCSQNMYKKNKFLQDFWIAEKITDFKKICIVFILKQLRKYYINRDSCIDISNAIKFINNEHGNLQIYISIQMVCGRNLSTVDHTFAKCCQ